MDKPIRVQRKRVKGWKMPPNTVYVGRPTKWGNEWSIKARRTREDCVRLYENKIRSYNRMTILGIVDELKGKNLACWCPLNVPCHADILLEIANQ